MIIDATDIIFDGANIIAKLNGIISKISDSVTVWCDDNGLCNSIKCHDIRYMNQDVIIDLTDKDVIIVTSMATLENLDQFGLIDSSVVVCI